MNKDNFKPIDLAKEALKRGDKSTARYWAREAIAEDPSQEQAWLILAGFSSPKASLTYLNKALEINPSSNQARTGMHWAIKRYRSSLVDKANDDHGIQGTITMSTLIKNSNAFLQWAIIFAIIILGLFYGFDRSNTAIIKYSKNNSLSLSGMGILKASPTPTPTSTPTPTPTSTITPSPTPTSTATITETPIPTETPLPPPERNDTIGVILPGGVSKGENWIDVDLTNQRIYAFQGKNLLMSFIVSTGTWQHPTVTGQYRIYVKYNYANMAGPGYFLPNVPYVMYFYKGYGIHGTYWHNNFGVPMSHGCVNLRTEDAGWMFNWASIGTLVNIHY